MSKKATLPDITQISRLLSITLPTDVTVKRMEPSAGSRADLVTAIYTDDQGEPIGACVCDLELAACLGAAFVLIPAEAAREAVAQENLSDSMRDNLYEVLNIAAQLLRPRDARHRVVFGKMYLPGQALPDDLAADLKQPEARLDVEVTISNYTTGKMSLVIIAPKAA